jgi:hypothetical protein
VRKRRFFEPFSAKNDHFAETGWGTNIGKAEKKGAAFSVQNL